MITDLDETIREILKAELPIKNGEIDVKFDQPKREWSARLSKPTINFYLYDVRENHILRRHQWERINARNGHKRPDVAVLKRTPFRVDCYYMLTVWASEPEDEHRLLTRCMMALFRFPTLPQERLVGNLKEQPFEIQSRLASHDKLTNPAEVWSALDNEIRPSLSYLLTIALDPWSDVTGPAVKTFTMRTGKSSSPRRRRFDEGGVDVELNYIGGEVRSKGKGKEPLAGIDVAIKGTGYFGRTDVTGRYIIGGIQPGKYTLVAWPETGKPVERAIDIPVDDDGNYDIEI